jgi:hypothetical protein
MTYMPAQMRARPLTCEGRKSCHLMLVRRKALRVEGDGRAARRVVAAARVDRARRDQRLRNQRQPAGMSPAQGAGHGRAAQFGLGQLPQVSFRASAVHVLSVFR